MSKVVRCPSIFCDGVGIPVDTKKKFSLGKAASNYASDYYRRTGKYAYQH